MKFMRNIPNWRVLMGASVVLVAMSCPAGVTVTQNVAPGATSWPGSPIIQTVTNPAVQVAVGESFNAVGGCTNYTQTFTITTTNYTLQTISIYAGGGTGTGVGTNVTLRLFDLGNQTAPNPSPYPTGTDLFNSGNGLAITYASQTAGVLQFDFTGSNQVTLTNGRMYAFEINGVLNSSPLVWQRTISDTYAGGAAYRNQSWINGNNAREFALAVYGSVVADPNAPPATNVTLVKFEAESGALGADWIINNGTPTNITSSTDGGGDVPGSAARVATYAVTFPQAGTYDLYARIRVGSGGASDDSLFYGNGFGVKLATTNSDWILVNGLPNVGFANSTDVVTGGGSAGINVWKWINLSRFGGGISFNVPNGGLTQTFQIGARENGLDFDAFVFGIKGVNYTVAELDAGAGGTFPDGHATLNWNDPRQQMDGFGAGVVFLDGGVTFTDSRADTLFKSDTINQLALTLLRVRIEPNNSWTNSVSGWSGSVNDAKRAALRGAGVLATPWTPPAAMKTSTNTVGGSLLPGQYANYAAYLEKYASNMLANGVSLRAVSVQNEPDWDPDYEGCVWSGANFLDFFRTNAGVIKSAPVMMPESLGFNFNYSDLALNDAVAVTNIDFIGGHLYGVNTITPYANAFAKGKRVWQTEYLENDQSVESAIETMKQIHECLTTGSMSAYIWWKCLDDDNGLLNGAGVIQKRGYMMSQFSRFVRPGHYRIGGTNLGSSSVSAFKNSTNNQFAIVAINPYSPR